MAHPLKGSVVEWRRAWRGYNKDRRLAALKYEKKTGGSQGLRYGAELCESPQEFEEKSPMHVRLCKFFATSKDVAALMLLS